MDWSSTLEVFKALNVVGTGLGLGLTVVILWVLLVISRPSSSGLGNVSLSYMEYPKGGSMIPAVLLVLFAGALVFPPSIVEIQIPLQNTVGRWVVANIASANPAYFTIPTMLISGLVQEIAKFLVALLGIIILGTTRGRSRLLGFFAGAGYGLMEAAVLLSAAYGLTGSIIPLALVERAIAIPFHAATTGVVITWWQRGVGSGLLALLGVSVVHGLLNYLGVTFLANLGAAYTEAIMAVYVLVFLIYYVKLRRATGTNANYRI